MLSAFSSLDQQALELFAGESCGSVALCALIIGEKLIIANLGDSRALLLRKNWEIQQLSTEHTPEKPEECERIEKLGGYVLNVAGKARLQGSLAVSRAVGDAAYRPFLSNVPDIREFSLQKNDKFLVLATDGLWNVILLIFFEKFIKIFHRNTIIKKLASFCLEIVGFVNVRRN